MRTVQYAVKRLFDIAVSTLMILMLTAIPVLIIIPVVIKLTSKGPAVFKQRRVGRNGKEFNIYKFRTMLIPEERIDKDGNVLEPNDSITKVGQVLRKTSLDELPQLFNILRGEMSFVGPRPMLPSQVRKISDTYKNRHKMRPGITGLAQVNGRNNLTWDKKLEYDMQYIENFSLGLDLSIFIKTVRVVLLREGIEYVHTMDKQ